MSLPYKGTVRCQVKEELRKEFVECGVLAVGLDKLGRYVCKGHADMCLVAGLWDKPLPVPDESLEVMMKVN